MGGVVLSASGYIVAHHKINLNSKVTGRVKWIGVEKGDKVKEGQILVRLDGVQYESRAQMLGIYAVRYRGERFLIRTHAVVIEHLGEGLRT